MIYVADTHALIWHLGGSSRLGSRAKAVLAEEQIVVPSICLAEASFLRERGEEVADITRNGELTRSGLVPVIW